MLEIVRRVRCAPRVRLVAVVLIAVTGLVALSLPSLGRWLLIERPDEPAPPMRVIDVEGRVVDLAALPGTTFIDVTIPGCGGCEMDKPGIAELGREFGGRLRFAVVIGGGFTGEGLRAESRDMGVEHLPVYGYRGPDLMPPFIRAYPTKLLVRDGRVVARQVGGCGHIPALWAPLLTAELRRTPPRTNP